MREVHPVYIPLKFVTNCVERPGPSFREKQLLKISVFELPVKDGKNKVPTFFSETQFENIEGMLCADGPLKEGTSLRDRQELSIFDKLVADVRSNCGMLLRAVHPLKALVHVATFLVSNFGTCSNAVHVENMSSMLVQLLKLNCGTFFRLLQPVNMYVMLVPFEVSYKGTDSRLTQFENIDEKLVPLIVNISPGDSNA